MGPSSYQLMELAAFQQAEVTACQGLDWHWTLTCRPKATLPESTRLVHHQRQQRQYVHPVRWVLCIPPSSLHHVCAVGLAPLRQLNLRRMRRRGLFLFCSFELGQRHTV